MQTALQRLTCSQRVHMGIRAHTEKTLPNRCEQVSHVLPPSRLPGKQYSILLASMSSCCHANQRSTSRIASGLRTGSQVAESQAVVKARQSVHQAGKWPPSSSHVAIRPQSHATRSETATVVRVASRSPRARLSTQKSRTIWSTPPSINLTVRLRDMVNLRRNQVVGALHLQLRPPVAAARRVLETHKALLK